MWKRDERVIKEDCVMLKEFVKRILVVDVALFAAAATIARIGNWWTVEYYVDILTLMGVAVIGGGMLIPLGGWRATRNFRYQYASSAGSGSISERQKIDTRDTERGYGYLIFLGLAGGIPILCAVLIDTLVG